MGLARRRDRERKTQGRENVREWFKFSARERARENLPSRKQRGEHESLRKITLREASLMEKVRENTTNWRGILKGKKKKGHVLMTVSKAGDQPGIGREAYGTKKGKDNLNEQSSLLSTLAGSMTKAGEKGENSGKNLSPNRQERLTNQSVSRERESREEGEEKVLETD